MIKNTSAVLKGLSFITFMCAMLLFSESSFSKTSEELQREWDNFYYNYVLANEHCFTGSDNTYFGRGDDDHKNYLKVIELFKDADKSRFPVNIKEAVTPHLCRKVFENLYKVYKRAGAGTSKISQGINDLDNYIKEYDRLAPDYILLFKANKCYNNNKGTKEKIFDAYMNNAQNDISRLPSPMRQFLYGGHAQLNTEISEMSLNECGKILQDVNKLMGIDPQYDATGEKQDSKERIFEGTVDSEKIDGMIFYSLTTKDNKVIFLGAPFEIADDKAKDCIEKVVNENVSVKLKGILQDNGPDDMSFVDNKFECVQ